MSFEEEVNAAIETLCGIAERARETALSDLITEAQQDDRLPRVDRQAVAELALVYAEWTRSLDLYRGSLRRPAAPVRRIR